MKVVQQQVDVELCPQVLVMVGEGEGDMEVVHHKQHRKVVLYVDV